MNEKDLDFGVTVLFSIIIFILLLISFSKESIELIVNAGQVMILLFNISLICFSFIFGKALLAICLLISCVILTISDIIIEKYRKLDYVDKLIIILITVIILSFSLVLYNVITSEPVEMELKDDYKKQLEGVKCECNNMCFLKDKNVYYSGWGHWNEYFLCTCCDKIYTKDIWGNKYTGCETYSFNREDWVQGMIDKKESLGESKW